MKSLLCILFLCAVTVNTLQYTQDTETLRATFKEYSEATYYFMDTEGYAQEFQHIKKEVLDLYNLKDVNTYNDKTFTITYTTDTEEDEDGDDIYVSTITALKLIE